MGPDERVWESPNQPIPLVPTVLSTSRNRAARFHALDKNLRPAFVRRLHRFFVAQSRRVLAAYLAEYTAKGLDGLVLATDSRSGVTASQPRIRTRLVDSESPSMKADLLDEPAPQPPHVEELLHDQERHLLWLAVLPFILRATLASAELAGSMVGLHALVETDPRVQRLLRDAELRLASVHASTLAVVRETLAEGFARGYSPRQIAYGVPGDGFVGLASSVAETYAGRARTIATDQIVVARQRAALKRYQDAGVAMVRVMDGAGCQWITHDSGGQAAGTIRTVIEAYSHPSAHPHCSRVFVPLR